MEIRSNLTQQEEAQLKNQIVNINAIPLKFVYFENYHEGNYDRMFHFELQSFERTETHLILRFSREQIIKLQSVEKTKVEPNKNNKLTLFDL
jgi:hypothetical protein